MRTITIEISDEPDKLGPEYTVRAPDGRFADRLCWDEALGTVVELMHPQIGHRAVRYLKTPEQNAAERRRHAQRMAQLEAERAVAAANLEANANALDAFLSDGTPLPPHLFTPKKGNP